MNRKFEVEKLDHFGKGVSHLDNKVLFIENALDEEVVEVKIESEKKKVIFGSAINIIEESPNRKEPECPYYNLCGGCNVMHMNYRKQLDFKFNKVSELLERFAGVSRDKIKEIISSNEFNYRNKATFKVGEKLSYCKNKTYELIGIDKCIICSEKINELVSIINNLSLSNIEEVIIRSTYKNESMIVFKLVGDINRDYFIRNLEKYTDTLIIIKDGIEEVLFGKGFITEKIGDYYFKISPRSFFQVNTVGAQKLYNVVKKYADLTNDEFVLDLYCGTGTIGIYLSDKAKKVVGIEINDEAVKDANENRVLNNINNIEFICRDANKVINDYKDIDLVVVDPPRSGLMGKSINNIINISPKKIVYVSCDPATLARDINLLKDVYEVKEITLVDMFPNTYHVESVVLLESTGITK